MVHNINKVLILAFLICGFHQSQLKAQSPALSIDEQIVVNNEKAQNYLQEGKKAAAAQLYVQSAFILRSANQPNEAAIYYQKVLDINIEEDNRRGQMIAHNSLAMVYLESENYQKAIYHLEKEMEFRKQINNKADIITVLINLAQSKSEIRSFDSAIDNIEQAIFLSKELNDLPLLKRSFGVAYDIYEKQGNETKSRAYFDLYSAIDKKLKDQKMAEITTTAENSVNQANTEKAITEKKLNLTSEQLEVTASNLQKIEKLTHEQQMELDLKEAKISEQNALLVAEKLRRKYLTIGVITLSLFVIVLSIMILLIRKANKKINHQRLSLEKQNKEIRSSIRYALTIQQAILPSDFEIQKFFDPLIIYRAKDIVSGDFYWISSLEDKLLNSVHFAVVDCTGHGVPGAFMSMIGNRLLNEIVNEKQISSPAEILTELNSMIRIALRQEETDNNDGMDVAIFHLQKSNKEDYKLTFSGAKRPLYILKNGENKLISFRGDRHSIGGYSLNRRETTFTNFETTVNRNDMVYLFSDGILDQNGPDRKKFGRSRLEEIFEECSRMRPIEQKQIIEKQLDTFMAGEEQRDDITLIGLKII